VSGLCDRVTRSATLAVVSDGLLSPATFANPTPIALADFSPATPYPSTIEVSCVPAPLTQLTVTLTNLSHTYDSDVDILLVSPSGQAVMLLSDVGAGNPINNAIISFSDAALTFLSGSAPVTSGVYKPTNFSPDDNMPVPAPLGPYDNTLAAFNGSDPNGTWSLYVVDDALMDTGTIAGGWSLTVAWESSVLPSLLSAPNVTGNGCAQATLRAQSGKTYTIEASTDLRTWTPILTNTLSGPTWNFLDAGSTNFASRFYRAVLRP
jgi:subtilisin-like proprotein convertase family protein